MKKSGTKITIPQYDYKSQIPFNTLQNNFNISPPLKTRVVKERSENMGDEPRMRVTQPNI